MADTQKQSTQPDQRRWLKWLGWCAGGLIVVLVAFYFVITSSAFFKSVVLPRVGSALNADISVGDLDISPFSHVVFHNLKVTPKDAQQLFVASIVTARYDLLSILRGRLVVDEFSVTDPAVTITENADGTSNLDSLLKSGKSTPQKATRPPAAAPTAQPSIGPVIDIKSASLKNAAVRYVQNLKNGVQQTLELTKVNVTVSNVRNDGAGQLNFSGTMGLNKTPPAPGSNTTLQANVGGAFTFHLTRELKPVAISGNAEVTVNQATGNFADLQALAAKFNCEVTPTDIKQCVLSFSKEGAALGDMEISGPFDPVKKEGKLKVEVASLDRRVLNLAGAAFGIDFGTTTINTSNEIELTKGGTVITAAGTVNVARFEITRQKHISPALDLRGQYDLSINRPGQTVLVRALNLAGTQNQHLLLQADLTNPMTIAWGNSSNAVGNAILNVTVAGLDLKDWKAFAGEYAPSGVANLKLKLQSQQAGQQLVFDLDGQVDQLSARVGKDRTPPVDVQLKAAGIVAAMKQFHLNECRLELAQQRQSVLSVTGTGSFDRTTHDANLQMTAQAMLDRMSVLVAHWIKAVDEYTPSGKAIVQLNVQAKQAGKQLAFDVDGQVDQFSARVGKSQLSPLNVHFVTRGTGTDLNQFSVSSCQLDLTQQNQSVLAMSGTGTFNRTTFGADVQVTAKTALDRLAALIPQSDVACSTGTLDVTSHVTNEPQMRSVTGQLVLADLTGHYGDYQFDKFGATIDLDALLKGKLLEIRKATGQFRRGSSLGGKFDVAGNFDLDRKTGQLTAKLADFTENDLGPFLQPSLGYNKLVSVSLNTTASARFDTHGNGSLKADAQVGNLVVRDPKVELPATPLEVHLQIDAAGSNRVVAVHQCQLALTPTERAKNELRLSGMVDYSKSSAIAGHLKLTADSLDATAYYDLFSAKNKTGETKSSSKTASGKSESASAPNTKEQKEPAAVKLPVGTFTCDAKIDRFYLRQVDISNLVTTAKLDGGHVVIKPCQLALNGAPVNATADLDLGVPGYKYNIAFNADKVPLQPLVNSFSPTYSDKAQGDLTVSIQIQGAGITGRSLQKNLTGRINVSLTNANIQIVGPKVKAILTPIALVLGTPELLSSPLDYVTADLQLGDGKIETRKFVAHSAAFLAESQGTIPMAEVLMDSPLNQPVDIALAKDVGGKLGFANPPVEGSYTKLPTFVHLTGTLGDPSAKTDKAVIAGLTARSIGGAVGGQAGSILQGLGSFLTGQPATGTNAPSGNQSIFPVNPLDLFRQPRRR